MKYRIFALLALLSLIVGVMPIFAQDDAVEYPITVEHQFGSTTIPSAPQRVVSIGYTEQDYLLALGITPIAVRYWYGEESDTVRPWAVDYIEGEAPTVLNLQFGALNYEAILELQPDLISAVTAGLTEEEYNLLSEIAPVLTQSADFPSFGMPWPEVTLMLGEAFGKTEQAQALVEETQGLFDVVVESNPQFVGKSAAVGYYFENLGLFTAQDNRGDFFTRLGFVIPEEVQELAGDSFYVDINPERLDLLDQDVLALVSVASVEGGIELLEADPLYGMLNVVQEDRVIYLTSDMEDAISYNSPLSLAFAIETIVPELQAIFGEEETVVSAECDAGYRFFDHEFLGSEPVCIPENIENIAVLDLALLEAVLLHGIEPVATYGYGRDLIIRSNPYINVDVEAMTSNTSDVGIANAVNLEVLLEREPDVIIAHANIKLTADLDVFEAIAPTLLFVPPLDYGEYRASVEFVGALLDTDEVSNEVLSALDDRLAVFREQLGDELGQQSISLVRLRDALVVFISGSFGDNLIHEAGLIRPEAQQVYDLDFVANENNGLVGVTVSDEALPVIDADTIIVWTASQIADVEEAARELLPTLQNNPLWQTLEAVQNERLFIVGTHWQGFGIFEAHAGLDDLFRYILDVDPQEVAPNPFID